MSAPAHDEPPRESRRMRWFRRAFVVFYIGVCFLIGSAFIFVSSLKVSTSFEVYGRPHIAAGKPALFRVWARNNNPPGPLESARFDLSLLDPTGETQATHTTEISGESHGQLALSLPAGLKGGTYTLRARLETAGEERETLDVPIEVEEPGASVVVLGGRGLRTSLWEGEDGPDRADLISSDGVLCSFLSNEVIVRVTDRETAAPRPGVQVALELSYGDLESKVPGPLTTDELGLASFRITPIGETEWKITTTAPDGVVSHSRAVLHSETLGSTMTLRTAVFHEDEALAWDLRTVHMGKPMYFELMDAGRWIASHREETVGETEKVRWSPELGAPSTPQILTLIACPDEVNCVSGHARQPVIWSAGPMSDAERLGFWLNALRQREIDPAWTTHLEGRALGDLNRETRARLERLMTYRLPTEYTGLMPLLLSDDQTEPRLEAFQDDFRAQANILLVLVLVAGLLIVMVFGVSAMIRRARETAAVLADIDEDIDAPAGPIAIRGQRLSYWLAGAWLVIALLTIIAFVWGILLLFQHL